VINPHRHDPKPKKVTTAASPKSKPKKAEVKRTQLPNGERLPATPNLAG
jgi:hypothetical protein